MMYLTRILPVGVAVVAVGLSSAPVTAQSSAPAARHMATMTEAATPITFTGAAVRDSAKSRPVQIVLERWSTDAEREKVVAAFASDAGPVELAKQFREMAVIGSFRTISGQANPIRYAREYQGADGMTHLVLLSGDQIQFWEGAAAPGTVDRAYTLIEVRFGGEIQGEGKVTHEAGKADPIAGRVMIDDYDGKSVALIGIQKLGSETPIDYGM